MSSELTSPDLIQQGLSLLIFGMSIVFVFLTLLVIATSAMSKVVQRFLPEPILVDSVAVDTKTDALQTGSTSGIPDARILAVIKEAIKQHREKSK